MVKSRTMGHEIYYKDGNWYYLDDGKLVVHGDRPCVKCKEYSTKDGFDPCIGYVPGAKSVCCGHGFDNDEILIF